MSSRVGVRWRGERGTEVAEQAGEQKESEEVREEVGGERGMLASWMMPSTALQERDSHALVPSVLAPSMEPPAPPRSTASVRCLPAGGRHPAAVRRGRSVGDRNSHVVAANEPPPHCHACVRACVCACVRARVRACVREGGKHRKEETRVSAYTYGTVHSLSLQGEKPGKTKRRERRRRLTSIPRPHPIRPPRHTAWRTWRTKA